MLELEKGQELKLRDYQELTVDELRREIARGNKRIILMMPTGCHAKGHPILMHDGRTKPVEDVKVGDELMGPDSKPRKVLRLARGRQEMRLIKPIKGEPFIVNLDHKLSIKKVNEGRIPERIETITVRQYEEGSNNYRRLRKLRRAGVEFKESDLPINPYFMGLMLSDGAMNNKMVRFFGSEKETLLEARRAGEELNCKIFEYADTRNEKVKTIYLRRHEGQEKNNAISAFENLGLMGANSYKVFIPDQYKTSSRKQRLELLAGLVDGDGSKNCNVIDYSTVSIRLAEDIVYLCRSLGLAAYMTEKDATLNGRYISKAYRISISGHTSEIPCRIPYKQCSERKQKKDVLCTGFSVEKLPEDDYYGFTLSGDHLYLDGSFTVHHNTGKTELFVGICQSALKKGKRVAFSASYSILVNQTVARLFKYGTNCVGVMQGQHEMTDPTQPVQVCTHQTIAARQFPEADLVFIDECHLQYQVVADWMEAKPNTIFIGLTATPFSKGLGQRYSSYVRAKSMQKCLDDKTLCQYKAYTIDVPDDTGAATNKGGDYTESALEKMMGDAKLAGRIVENWLENSPGQTIVYAINVKHANELANQFSRVGVSCEVVTGNTPDEERKIMYSRFDRKELKMLVSVEVLVAGADFYVDCLVLAFKTKSKTKLVQVCGRGLRNAPGKEYCTIYDHGGNFVALGLPEDIDADFDGLDTGDKNESSYEYRKEDKPEKKPKQCSSCGFTKPAGVHACPECGFAPRAGEDVETKENLNLVEIDRKTKNKKGSKNFTKEEKQDFWAELLGYQAQRAYVKNAKPVKNLFLEKTFEAKFGEEPSNLKRKIKQPTPETLSYIKSRRIAYAKAMKAKERAAAANS